MRQDVKQRRAEILAAALRAAADTGYMKVTRDDIALRAKCSPALVSQYFGTMHALRRTLMREAVRVACLPVIAQGLAMNDKHATDAPEEVKTAALATLRG